MKFKYLLFRSSIDLLDEKDVQISNKIWQIVIWSENVFIKIIWYCSYHGYRNFDRERFLGGEHLSNPSTKTA